MLFAIHAIFLSGISSGTWAGRGGGGGGGSLMYLNIHVKYISVWSALLPIPPHLSQPMQFSISKVSLARFGLYYKPF